MKAPNVLYITRIVSGHGPATGAWSSDKREGLSDVDGILGTAYVPAADLADAEAQRDIAMAEADRWAAGYGPIRRSADTQARVFAMAEAPAVIPAGRRRRTTHRQV